MAANRFASVVLIVLGFCAPAAGQIDAGTPLTGLGGGSYQDENARAAKAYRQGLKFRQRAEKAAEAAEREELYKQALAKYYESAGYVENFDARLAMGEVYLALGDKVQARKAARSRRS